MPRRARPPRQEIKPDIRYNNVMVAKFINKLMKGGKKSLAARILYHAFDMIEERTNKDPVAIFEWAISNASPVLEVRPRRVGGATYQIPMEVPSHRRTSLAMRWLVQSARERPERTMAERLANELMDASKGRGGTIRKKENVHKMAEANKAFAHYRW